MEFHSVTLSFYIEKPKTVELFINVLLNNMIAVGSKNILTVLLGS